MRDPKDRLRDILEAVAKIERQLEQLVGTFHRFGALDARDTQVELREVVNADLRRHCGLLFYWREGEELVELPFFYPAYEMAVFADPMPRR